MESVSPGEIDSALCAGLKDPRERANLFRLEQCYIDFCNSTSLWMDVGGAYNRMILMGPSASGEESARLQQPSNLPGHQTSFHRLLVHRLADRFFIRRESRGITCIRLFKCPETAIPAVLVQNLDPAIYYPPEENSVTSNSYPSINDSQAIDPSQAATSSLSEKQPSEKQPRKKVLMKKKTGNNVVLQRRPHLNTQQSQSSDNSSEIKSKDCGNSADLMEARERAYAEARARIFNEGENTADAEGIGETASATPLNIADDGDVGVVESMTNLTIHNNLSQQRIADTAECPGEEGTPAMDADRKAVYRNRAEEAADPDFQRARTRAVVVQTPMSGPVAAYNNHFYPSMQLTGAHPGANLHESTPSTNNGVLLTASAPAFVPSNIAKGYVHQPQGSWTSPNTSPKKTGSKAPPIRYNSNPEHQRGQQYRAYNQQPQYHQPQYHHHQAHHYQQQHRFRQHPHLTVQTGYMHHIPQFPQQQPQNYSSPLAQQRNFVHANINSMDQGHGEDQGRLSMKDSAEASIVDSSVVSMPQAASQKENPSTVSATPVVNSS